jgi:hypothetical protein
MTVKELIERLAVLPPDAEVVVREPEYWEGLIEDRAPNATVYHGTDVDRILDQVYEGKVVL